MFVEILKVIFVDEILEIGNSFVEEFYGRFDLLVVCDVGNFVKGNTVV
jgi:hypothetical protein